MSAPLRIGVLGAGHLGRIHLRCLQSLGAKWQTVGFFDPDPAAREGVAAMAKEEGWAESPAVLDSADALFAAVDAVATVSYTHLTLPTKA